MNRFHKKQRRFSFLRRLALPMILFLCAVFFLFYGISSVSRTTQEEEMKSLKQSVIKSAVHCYAAEGIYPESLSYLEEHYGITYDHDKYLVIYEITGANLMPEVDVISLDKRRDTP